ncbi:hypothetical protein BJ322DRAFT_1077511 [Thelephora terrestris]|uniref:BTB domain-containing protein n=1 Tax=Thelephora terrestris TaxID=56493 RepID=A0A9P6H8C5_9AGAM|nr:hypothetical protein BJ322DRAFT_1077511 [Thelephora terrestris]
MSSGDPSTAATTVLRPSLDFCANGADVVIRPAGGPDFRAHKAILSLVSPVFKDMFTLPQPPPDTPETLPHVDVQESPKTWEIILRTIYPTVPNPTIDTLDDLQSLLSAAQIYEMECVIEAHQTAFENQAFLEEDSLRLFSIACACEFEDQATYVARNAEILGVTRRFGYGFPKGLTLHAYGQLVSFLVERDNEWHRILQDPSLRPQWFPCCKCGDERLYSSILEDLRRPCLQAEKIYVKALELRRSACSQDKCWVGNLRIKKFIESMIEERERVCTKFQPPKWFVKEG